MIHGTQPSFSEGVDHTCGQARVAPDDIVELRMINDTELAVFLLASASNGYLYFFQRLSLRLGYHFPNEQNISTTNPSKYEECT